jgi:lipopolysaccharide export system permease protein
MLVWSMKILRYLYLITDGGASIFNVFQISIYILLPVFLTILPITFLLATILVYNNFLNTREIIILKNCGLTRFQLLKPIIFLSIIAVFLSYFLTLYSIPKSYQKTIEVKNKIWNNMSLNLFSEGNFTQFKNFTFYVEKKNDNNFNNILIYKKDIKGDILVQAKDVLIAGENIKLNNGFVEKIKTKEFLFFDSYVVNMGEFVDNEDISNHYKSYSVSTNKLIKIHHNLKKIKNLDKYIKDLENQNINIDKDKVRYEFHYRFSFPLSILLLTLLSGSLMLNGSFNRVSNKKNIIKALINSGIFYILLLFFTKQIKEKEICIYFLYGTMIIMFFIIINYINEKKEIS